MENKPLGSFDNPVKCKGIEGEREYLGRLVGPGGEPTGYARLGSLFGPSGAILDLFEVTCDALAEPVLVHLDMYAKGPREKRAVDGLFMETDFLKPKFWQKRGYMDEVMAKELGGAEPDLPPRYVYIYTKAAALLGQGPHIYARRDFFDFPLPEWHLAGLMRCAEQIVHHLRGLSAERPIQTDASLTARQFLRTMHFGELPDDVVTEETSGPLCLREQHLVTEEGCVLHFDVLGS